MAKRRAIYKSGKNYVCEIEPEGGWQRDRRGIRRILCKIDDVKHLPEAQLMQYLSTLHQEILRSILYKEAEEKKAKQQQAILKKNMTVLQAKNLWCDEIEAHLDKATIRDYKKSITLYVQAAGNHKLCVFTKQHNNKFVRHLKVLYPTPLK